MKTLENESDWRFKNCGLMALSQIGEYIEDPKNIAPIVPKVIEHFGHKNPKVRYAAIHCIGQLAEDMDEEFAKEYASIIVPALQTMLDDPVPRVQAHTCAAITNLFEDIDISIVEQYCKPLLLKLFEVLNNGISIIKENSVTAIAGISECLKESYIPYYKESLAAMAPFLTGFNEPCYKQLKG
jgi:vesicle coat complex subunit